MSQIHKNKHTNRNAILSIAGLCLVGAISNVILFSKSDTPPATAQAPTADAEPPNVESTSTTNKPTAAETRSKTAVERLKTNAALAAAAATVQFGPPEETPPSSEKRSLDEILAELKEILLKEPSTALETARDALLDHPDSEKAPELEWYLVRSLLELNRRSDAVTAAERMVEKYPGNSFSEDVRRHMLTPMGPPQ